MPLIVALSHRTRYRYDRPVALGPQTVRLRPTPHARAPILHYALTPSPAAATLSWTHDPLGNPAAIVLLPERVPEFEILVELVADLSPINPFDFLLAPEVATWPFRYPALLDAQLAPFRSAGPPGAEVAALAGDVGGGENTLSVLLAANEAVHRRISYVVRPEPGTHSPAETLLLGRGSCRDSAWLLVNLLRALGFAARFCSGYLIQLADAERPDRADLHAWAEAWLPGAGWLGLDATSGLATAEGHVPLAAAPEPHSVAPITGSLEAVEAEFSFSFTVERRPATGELSGTPLALRQSHRHSGGMTTSHAPGEACPATAQPPGFGQGPL